MLYTCINSLNLLCKSSTMSRLTLFAQGNSNVRTEVLAALAAIAAASFSVLKRGWPTICLTRHILRVGSQHTFRKCRGGPFGWDVACWSCSGSNNKLATEHLSTCAANLAAASWESASNPREDNPRIFTIHLERVANQYT